MNSLKVRMILLITYNYEKYMSTFKIKHDRNKTRVHINTLDETHKKIMNDFEKKRSTLPSKKKKLETLQNQLAKLDNSNPSEYSLDDIKRKADLKTEIGDLQEQIYDIENDISELEYYSKTGNIIMDYYDIIEMNDHDLYQQYPELKEQKEENDNTKELGKLDKLNMMSQTTQKKKKIAKKRKRGNKPVATSSIIDFMNAEKKPESIVESEVETEQETEQTTEVSEKEPTQLVQQPPQQDSINKAKLMDQYMMLIDSDYLIGKNNAILIKRCAGCDMDKTLIHAEGIYVCQMCGEAEPVIIDSEKPNYKESVPDNKPSLPYRKSNHLNEWLKNNIEVVVYGHKSRHEKCYLLVPDIEKFHKYISEKRATSSNCGKLLKLY